MKKRMMICLFIFGVLMIGTVSQGLSENNKAEGITSGASMSDQSDKPFFSKDKLILLAAASDCPSFIDIFSCLIQGPYPTCCWVNMNSSSYGNCAACR